jgi:glycosyltransferase involved in cell wall biosynthesis
MANGLVSIVVPTFNRAYCLPRTLDSALGQTYGNLELIVVDDGSSDNTRELVVGGYGREPRVKYIYQENRGVSAARNAGIRAAQGDYLAFLDSDDVWKPWKLELQVRCLGFLPHIGMIWTDMEAVDPQGTVFDRKYLRTMYDAYRWFSNEQLFTESHLLSAVAPHLGDVVAGGTLYAGDIFSPMVMGNLVHTSTVVIRRERFEKVSGFNEEWRTGEDHDYHLRTCREGPVGFIDLSSIQYQRGMPDRLTRFGYESALNFLRTVTAALERDREHLKLSRRMVHAVLAEANAWLGEQLLSGGDYPAARQHLLTSLRHRKWQPRQAGLLALSCLPAGFGESLRRCYRRLKKQQHGRLVNSTSS